MDAKTRNVIALLAIAVLVAVSLVLLLPMERPDTLQYSAADGTERIDLGDEAVVLGPSGPVSSSAEATTTATLVLRPGTATTGLSDWWVEAPTGSDAEQLAYGDGFDVGAQRYVLREGRTSITQGLDIRGGLSVIITAQPLQTGGTLTEDTVQRVETILNERVNGFGVSEASVQRQGQSAFLIQLPGVGNADEALDLLGKPGRLELFEVEAVTDPETLQLIEEQILARRESAEGTGTLPPLEEGTYPVLLTGDVITNAQPTTTETGAPAVSVTMNEDGAREWAEITTRMAGTNRRIAIALDGHIQSAPIVRTPITDGKTIIEGLDSIDEAKSLSAVLQSGALPARVVIDESRVVGPTLGQDSLNQGLLAGLVGLAFVAIFMALYYRGLGVVSWVSLALYGVIFLGVLAVLSSLNLFAMTLPGVAGIILTIGVAADTSILIFERLKEEVEAGKTHRSAAKSGVRHAILTSIDADVVTLVSALALYWLAIGPVKGFAFTLILGIIIDLVVAILFTGPIVRMLAEGPMMKAPALFGMKAGGQRG